MEQYNPFIQTEEQGKQNDALKQLCDRNAKLMHILFVQSEHGRELLDNMKESLMMSPTVTPYSSQFQAGIEEGKKEFIRNIILTVQAIEEDL